MTIVQLKFDKFLIRNIEKGSFTREYEGPSPGFDMNKF